MPLSDRTALDYAANEGLDPGGGIAICATVDTSEERWGPDCSAWSGDRRWDCSIAPAIRCWAPC
jgi:hypothetical protein